MKHASNSAASAAANGTPGDASVAGAAQEASGFVSDVEDLIGAATSLAGEDLARAKANLSARIAAARAAVGRVGSVVSERARSSAKATDAYVRTQTWQAIGVTAAASLMVGFLLGRRGS